MFKGGISGLMRQAQQMQDNMKKMQEQFSDIFVEGNSGAGAVKVKMNCKYVVDRISIEDSAYEDKEMLEDLLVAALNDAIRKVETTTQEKMSAFTAGIPLPPGMKFPF